MCVFRCVCRHTHARTCTRGSDSSAMGVNPYLPPYLRLALLISAAYTRLGGQRAAGNSCVSTSHFVLGAQGLQTHAVASASASRGFC